MKPEFSEWPKWLVNAKGEKRSFPSQEAADATGQKWFAIGGHPLDRDSNGERGGSTPKTPRKPRVSRGDRS